MGRYKHVAYDSTELAVGQTVAWYHREDKCLYQAEVQMLTDEQVIIGDGSRVWVFEGDLKTVPFGGSDQGPVRHATIAVAPKLQPTDEDADAAWGCVWLHGKWQYLTGKMTTPQREHAANAVARWSTRLAEIDNDPGRGEPEGLRWWRDAQ